MANFLEQLAKGAARFLTGGWPGAAIGLLSPGGSSSGASSQPPINFGSLGGNVSYTPEQARALQQQALSLPQLTVNANAAGGSAAPSLNLDDLYNAQMALNLAGGGGLPTSAVSQALATTNEMLNANAQRARESVKAALGQRGMLDSGVYGRALTSIEQQRGQAMSQAASQIMQRRLELAAQAQQVAAAQYAQLKQARWNAELEARRLGLSQEQIAQVKQEAEWAAAMELAKNLGQLYYRRADTAGAIDTTSPTVTQRYQEALSNRIFAQPGSTPGTSQNPWLTSQYGDWGR